MGKSNIDKKVNRKVKELNKKIAQDVFGNRFWLKQIQKSKVHDYNYYAYELRDREQPNRNRFISGYWIGETSILLFNDLWLEMNNFIIESDFWQKYKEANKNEE